MTGVYSFASLNVRVVSLYEDVHSYCREYQTDGVPDFTVETRKDDLDLERVRSAREDELEGRPVRCFPDAYLEELSVYRKIAEKMPYHDRFLLHGSAVAVGGAAYLFTAKSGTGKSTHTRLWRELLGEDAVMLNDDKPLLRITEDRVLVYGTPYDGKHRLSTNSFAPLQALCFLERSEQNWICSVSPEDVFPSLLQQVYRPSDPEALSRTLQLLNRMTASVRFYRLGCNMEIGAARLSYDTMKG